MVQILVHSHFDLVSWLLTLEATEPVSNPLNQMAVELILVHSHLQMMNGLEPLFQN